MAFPRAAVWVLLALLASAWGVEAFGQMRTATRTNVNGQADSFGYARVVKTLGGIDTGAGRTFPINLVFSSRPDLAPGSFGPGWHLPLTQSTVLAYTNYNLRWEAPDEYHYYFTEEQRGQSGLRGERQFMHNGRKWQARMTRQGDILIAGTEDPQWAFEYREGRLQRFRMGAASPVYRVSWRAGQLEKIQAEGQSLPALEISYRGHAARELRVGAERITVTLGAGRITGSDGRVLSSRGFLRELQWADGRQFACGYSLGEPRTRSVPDWTSRRPDARKQRAMPVNRMSYGETGGTDHAIEWEAESGFITADIDATYRVENRVFDPHRKNPHAEPARQERITPRRVTIRRFPTRGTEQYWERDWPAGILIHTDNATGERVRRTLIMSEGPAYLKTRRVERKGPEEEEWRILEQRAFDAQGRLVRKVGERGLETWVYSRDGREREYFHDDQLRRIYHYDDGQLVYRKAYMEERVEEWIIAREGHRRESTRLYDGELDYKEIFENGNPILKQWSNGRLEVWTEKMGKEIRLSRFRDGTTLSRVFSQTGEELSRSLDPDLFNEFLSLGIHNLK